MNDFQGAAAYLPAISDLRSGLGIAVASVLMAFMGTLIVGSRRPPELRLLAGWGGLCLGLTLWGSLTPSPMSLPLVIYSLLALAGAWISRSWGMNLGRLALLSVPLWLVMLPAKPSQMDTWLNLLPNAAYLYDHQMFPADVRPESYSFLPAAPYNTQFVAYFASMLSGAFASNGMSLFNIVLQLAAALLFARVIAGEDSHQEGRVLPWWVYACGLLLAIPLNLGFIPRTFLSAYGEAPLAVAILFAISLGARVVNEAAKGASIRREATALAFILAAMVNVKQSGIGLMLAFGASLFAIGMVHPKIKAGSWIAIIAAVTLPALVEYGVWRWYVLSHFASGELKPLPLVEWHFDLLPQILSAIGVSILKIPAYFVAIAAIFAGAVLEARRRPWNEAAITLSLVAVLVIVFNFYLLTVYVGHFPADRAARAHSYFRYVSQLSLAVTLGLLVWLVPQIRERLMARSSPYGRLATSLPIALTLLLPILGVPMLRFDLNPPQPALWSLSEQVAGQLNPGTKLGLLVPGPYSGTHADNEEYGSSLLRGVILFLPPRPNPIEVKTLHHVDLEALDLMQAAGYEQVLVSCTGSQGLAGVPPGLAALLSFDHGSWHQVKVWHYPHDHWLHWSYLTPHEAFCGS
jgi:hypothetical protein